MRHSMLRSHVLSILTKAADLFKSGYEWSSAGAGSLLSSCLAQPGLPFRFSCFSPSHSGLQCRRRHADVLEWLWFLQTHAEHLDGNMHGDKDMYKLAFALANKSEEYTQVSPDGCDFLLCAHTGALCRAASQRYPQSQLSPSATDTCMSCCRCRGLLHSMAGVQHCMRLQDSPHLNPSS